MKRFVNEEAESYDGLAVEFIRGRIPELVLLDEESGEETERIDLSKLSNAEIHALVQEKGFTRSEL